ncbi:MAG: hypothetical protein PHZ26_01090 [Candidatus Gracilibacteria bacterium]|nr:hypothetical protein [Candidatus Gracilibacteria bacterium]MDD2908329.1 hypothetical protein [Candidatus Gracilibacteria bacterium]
MSRIQPNQKKSNLSGLALPLIIALIVVILIIRAFFGGTTETNKNLNDGFVNVEPSQEQSEIDIYLRENSSPTRITGIEKLYPTDYKVAVVSGEAKITLEGNTSKIYLNKLGEIKYNGRVGSEENFSISNGDIWVEGNGPIKFDLKNFTISANNGVYSFTQYTNSSSVYVLKGEVNLTLNTGKKTEKSIIVGVGQKITILNADMTDSNLKAEDKIEPIDDYYKTGDFFIKHNGTNYLNNPSSDNSGTGELNGSGTSQNKSSKSIIINYPEDEATIESNILNIEGSIVSSKVEKVTLNDKEASINKEEKTFVAKDFELNSSINNIVYKAYDSDNNVLSKGVLTVYTSSKEKSKDELQKPTVTTYPISSKDFRIIEPIGNPFKTTENIVKIAGNINKGIVKFITINDFRLTKFPQFNSNWYYFANKDYGTMNDGINLYTIKYYGKDDELLYTSLFTIVKETATVEQTEGIDTSTGNTNIGTGVSNNG